MASCLGVHISNKVVKYARFTYNEKTKSMSLEGHGIKFSTENKFDVIKAIVNETKSESIPIVVSTYDDKFQKIQVFKQLAKTDINNVVNLEFEDWCEKKAEDAKKYLYTYLLPDVTSGDYFFGILNIVQRQQIEMYSNAKTLNISSVYPAPFTINRLVPKEEQNYLLVDLDDKLYLTTVVDGKVSEYSVEDLGMDDILDKFSELTGSYQKAYEACKQINVFSEGENENLKDLEAIIEPALQEILKRTSEIVNKHRGSINKILITGLGTLFTNIDILFREYFDIKSEILKPSFVSDMGDVRNVAEILESTTAIAIAYEYLFPDVRTTSIEYFRKVQEKGMLVWFKKFIDNLKKKDKSKPEAEKKFKYLESFDFQKLSPIFIMCSIIVGLLTISYLIFGNVYYSQIAKMKKEIDDQTSNLTAKTTEVNSDFTYVNSNLTQYRDINTEVENTVKQIEKNEIGSSTYNVAYFMQKIIEIIPKAVKLQTISSDDNKKVLITAQSAYYADLGYFVAQLKLEGVLNNVAVNKITNGTTITIEIGGELP